MCVLSCTQGVKLHFLGPTACSNPRVLPSSCPLPSYSHPPDQTSSPLQTNTRLTLTESRLIVVWLFTSWSSPLKHKHTWLVELGCLQRLGLKRRLLRLRAVHILTFSVRGSGFVPSHMSHCECCLFGRGQSPACVQSPAAARATASVLMRS